jgi:DNA-binding winged helix-turn-helix (wHTH) protein
MPTMIHAFGGYEPDLAQYEIRHQGVTVPVEPQVFDVLAYLVERRDRVVTKAELLDNIWGDRFVSESALTSRIKAARRAIGDDGSRQTLIRTAHGRGYRFVGTLTGEASNLEPASPIQHPPRLAGRRRELVELNERLARAAGGNRQMVFVAGSPRPAERSAAGSTCTAPGGLLQHHTPLLERDLQHRHAS